MKSIICLIITIYGVIAHAQSDTISIYFAKNEFKTNTNVLKLDSTWGKIKILGYCDYLGSKDYNDTLSKKRADFIKHALLEMGLKPIQNIETIAMGSVKSLAFKEDGEPNHRRVDIIVWKEIKEEILEIIPEEIIKQEEDLESQVSEVDVGKNLVMKKFSFQPGYKFLMEESKPALEELIKLLKENENLEINIEGHVCCSGGYIDGVDKETMKRNLSIMRAKYIYTELKNAGISTRRISYEGFGGSKPIYPDEKDLFEQQANRRVEIKIINK